MNIQDVSGRINTANLTADEWAALDQIGGKGDGWIVPSDAIWLACRGILALIDIRRGFEVKANGDLQLGVVNVRLNEHGKAALEHRARGSAYVFGELLAQEDVRTLVDELPKSRMPFGGRGIVWHVGDKPLKRREKR